MRKVITQENDTKVLKMFFDSLSEYYDFAQGKCDLPKNERTSRKKRDDDNWAGTASFADAIKLATYGWRDGLDKLDYSLIENDKLIKGITEKFKTHHDVSGAYVDVSRFLEGQPECMVEFENVINNKFATIYVAISVSGVVSSQAIVERGRKILSVIDVLESQNVRTKVIAVESCDTRYPSSYRSDTYVVLKEHKEKLDLDGLNFAICNPAFLRRITFSAQECYDKEFVDAIGFKAPEGYGHPVNILSIVQDADDVIIFDTKAGFTDWSDIDEKVKKITEEK